MTYKIGLTGGIGSGKTTASLFFSELGVPIIDADVIARDVASQQPVLAKIVGHFGTDILQKNGELSRQALRERIFNHPEDKQWLEQLLHPLINETISKQLAQIKAPYCIVVIPLLAEHYSSYQNLLEHIIVIDTEKENQLTWATSRDNTHQEGIQKIIQSQASREKRLQIADTILYNNGTVEELKKQISKLHRSILEALS